MKILKKYKKTFIITLSILCAAAMIVTIGWKVNPTAAQNAAGFVLAPVQKMLGGAADWLSSKVGFIMNLTSLQKENEDLRNEAELLRIENSRLKQVDRENERLSALLDIDRKYIDYAKTGAAVIGNDPGNWFEIILIDKGTKDGLQKNMVVLGESGLIGRVLEAGYNYSKVISVIDDTSSVSAKSARTEDCGFLKGDYYLMLEGKCRMEFIDPDAQLAVGDEIVTSHLSDIYPAGISIGYVTEVRDDGNGTKSAIVQPYTDFKHLETVLVINQLFTRELLDTAPGAESGQGGGD